MIYPRNYGICEARGLDTFIERDTDSCFITLRRDCSEKPPHYITCVQLFVVARLASS
jgi:hypothetical protein